MDSSTQQFSARVAVLAPWIVQLVAIICASIYIIIHDGASAEQVLSTLGVVAGLNVVGGTVGAVSGHAANVVSGYFASRTPASSSSGAPAAPTAPIIPAPVMGA